MLLSQVIHSQEVRVESGGCPAEPAALKEMKELQAELQDTLKALQQQQDQPGLLDDDKACNHLFSFPLLQHFTVCLGNGSDGW